MRQSFIFFLLYSLVESYLHFNTRKTIQIVSNADEDAGEPLYLTPYVQSGNIEEGKRLAQVSLTEDIGITSYAGFFTVDEEYFSNHFFWYFPPLNKVSDAPVILWLQGGPGASSLYGLFMENGPLQMTKDDKLEKRPINWATNHHMIFIDNPVGTGFSFTNSTEGLCTDIVQVGEQLYSTMTQFFQLFPDLQSNDFYISGESYAGKYVPALAYMIYKRNPEADFKINLKSIIMGNAWSDPIHQLGYGEYTNQLGLIDFNQLVEIESYQDDIEYFIKDEDWITAWAAWDKIIFLIKQYSGIDVYNYQTTKESIEILDDFVDIMRNMLNKTDNRKNLHVGELTFIAHSREVQENIGADIFQSVAPWISELLDHYEVFVYNGQADVIVGYPLTVNYLRNLNYSGAELYKAARRHFWRVGDDLAGYVKTAGKLTEILVRNSGHMVPYDQPEWAWDMITRITSGQGFIDVNIE